MLLFMHSTNLHALPGTNLQGRLQSPMKPLYCFVSLRLFMCYKFNIGMHYLLLKRDGEIKY